MLTVIKIIIITVIALFVLGLIIASVVMGRYMFYFYIKKCEQCNHKMSYKGTRTTDEGDIYYFYCKHCGKWKKYNVQELLSDL